MTDPKTTLLKLNQNLNTLREREAKFAGNAPLELLNQISDHHRAINLTRQAITGELSEVQWRDSLKPLLLAWQDGQVITIEAETYIAGDLQGDIVHGDQIITNIYEAPPPSLPPAEARERHDLDILLNKVKTFWIEGVLEKSIHNMALIDLGKETQAEAVAHAWEQVLELPDQSRQTLPPDKKISHIFDEMNRALLILGAPGSGKTITLLQLTRDLIVQAEQDESFTQPVPVVFNLSTWTRGEALIDWLVVELAVKYQIPQRIGRVWLENNRLVPLLDGLDEVRAGDQAGCVEAINHFEMEFGLSGLAVCSRLQEYTRLPVRLKLNGAIQLLPLTLEQIYDYLDAAGDKLYALREAMTDDASLRELAQSPLILGVMTLAYQDMPSEELTDKSLDSLETRRAHLFDTYIERMFKRKGQENKPYPDTHVKRWLSWVAQQMHEHHQTIFLVEQLQPDWLSSRSWWGGYILGSRLLIGLIIGIIVGLSFVLSFGINVYPSEATGSWPIIGPGMILPFGRIGLGDRLIIGVMLGLMGGSVVGLLDIVRFNPQKTGWIEKISTLWLLIINLMVIVAVIVLSFILSFGLAFGITEILIVTLSFGLCFGFIVVLRGRRQNLTRDIQPVETLSWSWNGALKGAVGGLILGLIVGIFVRLIWSYLGVILSICFMFMLAAAIFGGLSTGVRKSKTKPNEGIRSSIRNAVYTGLVFGLVVGVITGAAFWAGTGIAEPAEGLIYSLTIGLFIGLVLGPLASLWYGGLDVTQHYALRFTLYLQDRTPFNYVRLLDYAAERIFLQKVGGGYVFVHRLLLEHFAQLKTEPSPTKNKKRFLKWLSMGLVCMGRCSIIIIYLTNILPRSRTKLDLVMLRRQGLELAEQGKIEAAIAMYETADTLAPDQSIDDPYDLANLCWFGSLRGYANVVMNICDRAVELAPTAPIMYDSRGLARALTGNYTGAIEDYEFYVEILQAMEDSDLAHQRASMRMMWIEELEKGNNPFTEAVLEELGSERW